MEEHRDQLEEIAARHGKKFKDVLCIAGTAERYKSQWAVSDIQVKILYQVKENTKVSGLLFMKSQIVLIPLILRKPVERETKAQAAPGVKKDRSKM